MNHVTAVLSMLHEPGGGSAARLFRAKPVLSWTLQRLSKSQRLNSRVILCWDDQCAQASKAAADDGAVVVSKGARATPPEMQAVAAAQRWADGWRGGLLSSCHFDLGFHAPWHDALCRQTQSDALVLIDPSAAMIDPALVDGWIDHAKADASLDFCFSPAAPGFGGVLLKAELLARLAAAGDASRFGRFLHYHPDRLSREPLAGPHCVSTPAPLARTTRRFTLDSERQVTRLTAATQSLNGQLISSSAEELLCHVQAYSVPDALPREIVLELNTVRSTRPIFWAGRSLAINRPNLSSDQARQIFDQLPEVDDLRLTLAGVGDPLLSPNLFPILEAAKKLTGVSVHLETDLHEATAEQVVRLADAAVDVISVHLPALSPQTYEKVMGRDGLNRVIENLRQLLARRQARHVPLPIIVPMFTKCQENLGEMEAWYDHWLRTVGSAVVRGPSHFAGQIPATAVADMAPSRRSACARLASRVTILSDGRVVSCEEDVRGVQVLGRISDAPLQQIWRRAQETIVEDHQRGWWNQHPLCAKCGEWNRP